MTLPPTLNPSFSPSFAPVDETSRPSASFPAESPLSFTLSPTLISPFAPSLSPVNTSTSPPISFPTVAPIPNSFPPFQVEGEIVTKVANGDTYFFRNALPQLTQPSPMEETMLVRSGKGIQADAFSLISFPFQGALGLGIGDVVSSSFENREILIDICLSHVPNADGRNASTYTLCRVKANSWDVGDGDGSALETYQGIELAGMKMPDDCMGEELDLISFDIYPNETSICIDVSDLLAIPRNSSWKRQDVPSTSVTSEEIVMFFIDTFNQEQELEDRFYTMNSASPPLMIFYNAPTELPTFSRENSISPIETQLPTHSPSLLNADELDPSSNGLFGLLVLVLLCPLLFFWLARRHKLKAVVKDTDAREEMHIRIVDTQPTITAEVENLYRQDSNNGVGLTQIDPSSTTNEHGTNLDRGGSFPGNDDSSDSREVETAGLFESGGGHTINYDDYDSSSPSSLDEGDSNTNDDTFEDEMSGGSDGTNSTN
jgi:hypothetical protein